MKLATVTIKADTEKGFVIINASEFDEEKHELFDAEAAALPSREELEELAAEHEVKFPKNISDKKLAAKIDEAIAAKAKDE